MRVKSFKIDENLLARVENYLNEKNSISFSELVRRALREYLDGRVECKPFITRRIRIYC